MSGGGGTSRRLHVLSSPEELARAAAGRLWGIARQRAAAGRRAGTARRAISLALSGGTTPRLMLMALAAEPYRAGFPWDQVHIFQVDERWIPADDPLSNQRMLRESLLADVPLPPGSFHPVDTSLFDPSEGARRYEEALRRAFPAARGFPRFDAILLGLGGDGHTASLFPGSPALTEACAWTAATVGGDPPLPRVTLTLPVLCAASAVVFLVSGKRKAAVLAEVLSGKREDLPAARVSPRRGAVTFLADADAASALPGKRSPGDASGRPSGTALK